MNKLDLALDNLQYAIKPNQTKWFVSWCYSLLFSVEVSYLSFFFLLQATI